MPEALRGRVLDYLREHHVMTVATHGEAGVWAAAVFYANEGFTFYFLSSPASRHGRNLARSSRVSAAIHEDCGDWRKIKGVQLEGLAAALSGDEEKRARRVYADKFPLVGNLAQAPASIVSALAKVRWYRLIPERLYFIDNAAGFGHRDEIDLSASGG